MSRYQPFLDHAVTILKSPLADLRPYPIPQGFESKSAITGKGDRQENSADYQACLPIRQT
jgi:phycoerythrobilin:ferredoxin oxidoreductase